MSALRAGRRFAVVAARFERDVGSRAAQPRFVGLLQGDDLGVGPAEFLVPPLGDDLAVADDHAADHRVRLDGLLRRARANSSASPHESFV